MTDKGIQTGVLKADTITGWDRFLMFGRDHNVAITLIGLFTLMAGAGIVAAIPMMGPKRDFIDDTGKVFSAFHQNEGPLGTCGKIAVSIGAIGFGVFGLIVVCLPGWKKSSEDQKALKVALLGGMLFPGFLIAWGATMIDLDNMATHGEALLVNRIRIYDRTRPYLSFNDESIFKTLNVAGSLVMIGGGTATGFGIFSRIAAKKAIQMRVNRLEPSTTNSQSIMVVT
jgi:hypothetical protein